MREQLFDDIVDNFGVDVSYEVRVFNNYREVFLRTRNGECDIGWAMYFYKAHRERCTSLNFRTKGCLKWNETDMNTTTDTILTPFPDDLASSGESVSCLPPAGPREQRRHPRRRRRLDDPAASLRTGPVLTHTTFPLLPPRPHSTDAAWTLGPTYSPWAFHSCIKSRKWRTWE